MKTLKQLVCLFSLSLAACMPIGMVKNELDVIENLAPCKASGKILFVLLPGAYDTPKDFIQNGFITEVRNRSLAVDLILADTHIGYYSSALVVERLHQDIILPARQRGYEQIWLTGISLGGYGSLLYAQKYGNFVNGLFLIAPFLGNRSLIAEITNAGGIKNWPPGPITDQDDDRRFWSWLKELGEMENLPYQIHLGYGLEDRFSSSNRLLSEILPEENVMTVPGGHKWLPWKSLWSRFLAQERLPECDNPDN